MDNLEEKTTRKMKILKIIIKILKVITIINIIFIVINFIIYNVIVMSQEWPIAGEEIFILMLLILIIQIVNIVLLKKLSKKLKEENINWKIISKIIISVILVVITFFIPVGSESHAVKTKETGKEQEKTTLFVQANYKLVYKNIYYITLWEKYVFGAFDT